MQPVRFPSSSTLPNVLCTLITRQHGGYQGDLCTMQKGKQTCPRGLLYSWVSHPGRDARYHAGSSSWWCWYVSSNNGASCSFLTVFRRCHRAWSPLHRPDCRRTDDTEIKHCGPPERRHCVFLPSICTRRPKEGPQNSCTVHGLFQSPPTIW